MDPDNDGWSLLVDEGTHQAEVAVEKVAYRIGKAGATEVLFWVTGDWTECGAASSRHRRRLLPLHAPS